MRNLEIEISGNHLIFIRERFIFGPKIILEM